jgi:hypothetical protein
MLRLVLLRLDDLPLCIEWPERVPEEVVRVILLLNLAQLSPVLAIAGNNTTGRFLSA